MNMKDWLAGVKAAPRKKAMPILSFPSIQLLGISVTELISSAQNQAAGMKAVADRTDALAAVSMMDLSVEAERFGSKIRFSPDEVPTVVGGIVTCAEEAQSLPVPAVGAGRTGVCVEAIDMASKMITDRPIFAGMIGPFSLAGRLMDVSEAMIYCYDDPDMVHLLLRKVTNFLTGYGAAFKAAGANGVVMAEPLAGLLSPALAAEFSSRYVKEIVDALQDDSFLVIYHNCGGATVQMTESLAAIGAAAYHFGNAVDMREILEKMPPDVLTMGNLDPAGELRGGTPESVRAATLKLLEECGKYPNYVISSGCDIPPLSKWENIDAFFDAAKEYYLSG